VAGRAQRTVTGCRGTEVAVRLAIVGKFYSLDLGAS